MARGDNGTWRRCTDKQIENALRESGGIFLRAAIALGVTRKTVADRVAKKEKLQVALVQIKEETIDVVEGKFFEGINNGSTAAQIFFLKTQARSRGYNEKIELNFPAGVVILPERRALPPDPDEVQPAHVTATTDLPGPPQVIPPVQEG